MQKLKLGGQHFDPQIGHVYTQKKRKRIFFDPGKILIRVTVFEKKPKNDFAKNFRAPTAKTIQARLTKPLFLEAELNSDYFFFSTNFDPTYSFRRKSSK